MADIRVELAVEVFFVLIVAEVNNLCQYNCIKTNAFRQMLETREFTTANSSLLSTIDLILIC